MSWIGEILPKTAPKEIKTAAATTSALIKLQQTKVEKRKLSAFFQL